MLRYSGRFRHQHSSLFLSSLADVRPFASVLRTASLSSSSTAAANERLATAVKKENENKANDADPSKSLFSMQQLQQLQRLQNPPSQPSGTISSNPQSNINNNAINSNNTTAGHQSQHGNAQQQAQKRDLNQQIKYFPLFVSKLKGHVGERVTAMAKARKCDVVFDNYKCIATIKGPDPDSVKTIAEFLNQQIQKEADIIGIPKEKTPIIRKSIQMLPPSVVHFYGLKGNMLKQYASSMNCSWHFENFHNTAPIVKGTITGPTDCVDKVIAKFKHIDALYTDLSIELPNRYVIFVDKAHINRIIGKQGSNLKLTEETFQIEIKVFNEVTEVTNHLGHKFNASPVVLAGDDKNINEAYKSITFLLGRFNASYLMPANLKKDQERSKPQSHGGQEWSGRNSKGRGGDIPTGAAGTFNDQNTKHRNDADEDEEEQQKQRKEKQQQEEEEEEEEEQLNKKKSSEKKKLRSKIKDIADDDYFDAGDDDGIPRKKNKKKNKKEIAEKQQLPKEPVQLTIEIGSNPLSLKDLGVQSQKSTRDLLNKLITTGEVIEDDSVESAISDASSGKIKMHPSLFLKIKESAEGKSGLTNKVATSLAETIVLPPDTAEILMLEMGFNVIRPENNGVKDITRTDPTKYTGSKPLTLRPPVVTIMGHVDHGKTTLLDSLRNTSVAAGEAGGITQAVSAFQVNLDGIVKSFKGDANASNQTNLGLSKRVCFIDTPGHAAFTSMRRHGASVTDIIVLVISCVDGIQPQTLEVIDIANASKVPIVVAVSKVDSKGMNPELAVQKISDQLFEQGLKVEKYGGEVQVIPISAMTGYGLKELCEALLLEAEVRELKACEDADGEGVILESRIDKALGPVAEVIVRWGTLKVGDPFIVGLQVGKVRALLDPVTGKRIEEAGPSTPIRLVGLEQPPSPGQDLLCVKNESIGKQILILRERKAKLEALKSQSQFVQQQREESAKSFAQVKAEVDSLNLTSRFAKRNALLKAKAGRSLVGSADVKSNDGSSTKEVDLTRPIQVPIILKADTDGSLEALKYSVNSYNDKIQQQAEEQGSENALPAGSGFSIIKATVGPVTPQEIEFAETFNANIFGFNIRVPASVSKTANDKKVQITTQAVIYHLIDDMKQLLYSHLPKTTERVVLGEAQVLQVFEMQGKKRSDGGWKVAGCKVMNGKIAKKARFTVIRNGEVICANTGIDSLKVFKENVHNVENGNECGIALAGFEDFQPGDVIQAYEEVEKTREILE